uniref:ADAM metallopeptidase domain 8a n=1 Tax=Periophthalmus magnuspinnatus TaxID=409849 RepID=A0A3B4BFS2_9GOBI
MYLYLNTIVLLYYLPGTVNLHILSSDLKSIVPQTFPDVMKYSLLIGARNYTLHLERNIDLVGQNFIVTHYSEEGNQITTNPDVTVCIFLFELSASHSISIFLSLRLYTTYSFLGMLLSLCFLPFVALHQSIYIKRRNLRCGPVGVRVMLVGMDIWSYRDQIEVSSNPEITLGRFLEWRQQRLLPRIKHDNAQFITGVDFDGSTVGLANTNAMCTSKSGAVNEDHNSNSIGVASTIAHEMGHNLGLSHDHENCVCGSSRSKKGCIILPLFSIVYPELFSSCSQQQLSMFLEEINPECLLDKPSTNRIYGGPVCGNAFLEAGEECDCGTAKECKNPCCNATTCKLKEGAQCAEGACCHNCQLKPTGSLCRSKTGDCDLAEYCSGLSASCPADAYTQNGLPCNRGQGYCFNGQCPSRRQHCKRLWGPGKMHLKFEFTFPITSKKSYYSIGNNMCNEATMNPEDNYPADMGLVPTGTKCGTNMVAKDFVSLEVYFLHTIA